jgi:hypothetical protein
MILKDAKRLLAVLLSFVLTTASSRMVYGYQSPEPATGGGAEAAPMSAVELQGLAAPIALYPDPLVAQILAAATFPDQVAIADYWLQQNKDLSGKAFTEAVDKQSWDASVKALTQFPSALDNMAKNLTWTSSLGEAYHNQAAQVMEAIQTLRAKAKAAGNLKSGPQITVVQQTPQTIVIQPTNPAVVYVPEYDPALIYGTPYVVPGYTSGYVAAAGLLGFGAGIALGAWMGGGGWGWSSWNCDWHGGVVAYNHAAFYGNTAWHGGYYGAGEGYHGAYNNYHNAYNRNANVNRNVNRNVKRNVDADRSMSANSWSHDAGAFGHSNAFSGLGGDNGGSWSSRMNSFHGWGSMRAGGFAGGRFGGGGFGGGHFGGFHGGFHR